MADTDQEKVEDTGSETEEKEEEKVEKKEEKQEEEEIPVRQKPWSNRQERAEFFKNKDKKEKDEEEGEEELTPAAARAVQRELKKALDPFADVISKAQADSDVNSYLARNPSLQKYESQARKWMDKHPTLTAESAFLLATKGKTEEVDEDEKAKAEDKAKRGSLGGGGVRKDPSALPQTESEMKKVLDQVKRGKTVKLGE